MNEPPKRDQVAPNLLSHDRQLSDKDSVLSSDSYDSGVGSRSDEDVANLPLTPEKQSSKPITIEVVSPASRGVIELIDNGNDGYIGYFKPEASPESASCSSCGLKRNRVTRSISTNVSEDSNDSAFQGFRTHRRREANDAMKPATLSKKENNFKKSKKKTATPNKEVKTQARLSRKRHRSPSTPSKKDVCSSPLSKQQVKSSPGKRALQRIQHHNRSPERSAETVATTSIATTRNRCTRSHIKSLMKDIVSTPSLTSNKTSSSRPKHSLRKNSVSYKPANHRKPKEQCGSSDVRPNSMRSSRRSLTVSDKLKSEDSGVGSDDQQSVSNSACHWR